MRVADLITASVLMLLGGAVVYDALRLGIGWESDGPRSGFFPFWLGALLIVMCAVILVQTARLPSSRPFVRREQIGPVLKVLGPALAAVVLMHWIGLYVASAVYTAFYMRWIGRHSWVAVVAVAVGIPLVAFFVFERWFLVPMPKGPLEAWLGYA
jgi:putative tricarboxylic transport membrane protein